MINQLFAKVISKELLERILACYGLKNLDDTKYFTKYDLELYNTIEKLNDLKDELKQYYIPCKSKIYLDDITVKRCFTILRQVIKLFNYKLNSTEKYIAKKKQLAYQLIPENKDIVPKIINHKNMIITFD